MARYQRFTFLCDSDERRILAALARSLQRSQSDSVRWLIRNAAAELKAVKPADPAPAQAEAQPQEAARVEAAQPA
jgi:hypothetical protein